MSYADKLEHFRAIFETHHNERLARLYDNVGPESVEIEQGYKFDKVYINTGVQKSGRYMIESRTGAIYGIKSWTQVNRRRQFGTLDTVDDYDWSEYHGRPLPGTQAEKDHVVREAEIVASHKKRGRKPKHEKLSK
jgi:hypothetical protein